MSSNQNRDQDCAMPANVSRQARASVTRLDMRRVSEFSR
jgi:hypothetical protein